MRDAVRSTAVIRRTAGTTLVVALLTAVAVMAVLLWGRFVPLAPDGAPPIGEAARQPADPLAISNFAGLRQTVKPFDDFSGLASAGLLTPAEITAYTDGGPGRAKMAVGDFGRSMATVVVVHMRDPVAAQRTEHALARLQLEFGFTMAARRPHAVDATLLGAVPGKPGILPGGRAHYVHGDLVVRVEYRGPGAADAQRGFENLLATQLKALPADE